MAQELSDEDIIYDVKVAVSSIIDYVKHLMRDAQQKKAKEDMFEQISDTVAFWLKDFGQKVLPMEFREGQRNYFGKKGMSLHIDVIFF